MQAPGGGADAGAAANSWMANFDFLGAEELIGALGAPADMPFLDPATLNAVYSADQHCQAGHAQGGHGVPIAAQQQQNLKRLLPDDSDSDDDDCRGKPGTSGGKRGKGDGASDAARVKASKEKARRGKINDRFAELAKLIEPSGSEPKTDKPSILADAIKYVQQLTVENHQLRQLNKFLEERVSHYERERGQNLYQQSLMMQGMGAAPGMMPPQAGMMQPQAGMMPSQQPIMTSTQPLMPGTSQAQAMPGLMGQPQAMMQPIMQASGSGPAGMMQPAMMQAPGLAPMQQMARGSMPGSTSVAGAGATPLPMAHTHMQSQVMPMMPQQQQQQQAAYQQQQGQGTQLKSEPTSEQQGEKGLAQQGQGQEKGQGGGQGQQESGAQLQGQGQGQAGQAPADGAARASAPTGERASGQGHASDTSTSQQQQQQQQQQQVAGTMGALPQYGGMPMPMPMVPMPGAPQYQYYPAGLKPALGGLPGPMAAMQAMQMGGAPTPHWPSMGVDSAQQDSLLRPPVA